jgi:DNA-directed RNA polymerase specialized sigma24 family protein
VQGTALELFQLAALLLGDQDEAVRLVEETMARTEIDPCADPASARRQARQQVLEGALGRLRQTDPASFAVSGDAAAANNVCVEDEDLSAAGISHAQLTEWLASEGRQDLRDWLRALPAAQRAVFVQRAVLGQGNVATAEAFQASAPASDGKGGAGWWTPQAVGELYRLALCSLANSLAHSSGVLSVPTGGALA